LKRGLAACLVAGIALPALAQEGLGPGRRPKSPDICMTAPEMEAEAVVRAGMIIRGYARDCARLGHDGSILPLWAAFDQANAQQFRDAVQLRSDSYKRNYPDDAYAEQRATNAVVASRQLTEIPAEECSALLNLVGSFNDWDAFLRHVRMTVLGQVKTTFKQCPRRRGGGAGQ
jgi:hypothetical protein